MSSIPNSASGLASHSSSGRGIFDTLNARKGVLLSILGGIVVIAAVIGYLSEKKQGMSVEGRDAIFVAREAQEKELLATQPKPDASAAKTAPAAANPAAQEAAAVYAKLDVDKTFPETLKAYQGVIQKFAGTGTAYQANLAIGDLYFNHGQADKALPYYQAASKDAHSKTDGAMMEYAIGYTYEATGKPTEALDSLNRAISVEGTGLKGDILLAMARNYAALPDLKQATATYDRVISELPNTDYSKTAEILKAQLK